MSRKSFLGVVAVALLSTQIAGCTGVVVGSGAAVATAALEERGLKGAARDTFIRARINDLWFAHNAEMFQKVDLSVIEGRALLTGIVRVQQMRVDAVRLAWQAKGVKEVINEIQVADKGGLNGIKVYAKDSLITTQLVGRLLFDKQVLSINYSIETVGGIIYLMGIAQDQIELDRVTYHARSVKYVQKVVNYARLRSDPRRFASQ
jgi:osmotically-inducible protein OsmY